MFYKVVFYKVIFWILSFDKTINEVPFPWWDILREIPKVNWGLKLLEDFFSESSSKAMIRSKGCSSYLAKNWGDMMLNRHFLDRS